MTRLNRYTPLRPVQLDTKWEIEETFLWELSELDDSTDYNMPKVGTQEFEHPQTNPNPFSPRISETIKYKGEHFQAKLKIVPH